MPFPVPPIRVHAQHTRSVTSQAALREREAAMESVMQRGTGDIDGKRDATTLMESVMQRETGGHGAAECRPRESRPVTTGGNGKGQTSLEDDDEDMASCFDATERKEGGRNETRRVDDGGGTEKQTVTAGTHTSLSSIVKRERLKRAGESEQGMEAVTQNQEIRAVPAEVLRWEDKERALVDKFTHIIGKMQMEIARLHSERCGYPTLLDL